MTEFKSPDDFLNHRSQEGGGSKRLKSWAKDPGHVNLWFHTKQMPCAVWYHRIPELVVRKKKDSENETLKNVWGRQHVCLEDESILKKQRFRDDSGNREHPPKRCPVCRMIEAIRSMIRSGAIKDTDRIFKFDGSDKPEENVSLSAGGLANVWGRDPDDATKDRLKAAEIYLSKVWGENMVAKLSYVFAVVNQDDPATGLQVAIQTQLVGDKVKRLINNEIASNDGDLGNPFVNPYCIQLVYKPNEKKFDDKYDARRMNRFALSPAIEEIICGEKPDIRRYTNAMNGKEVMAALQEHALVKLPWDSILDVPEQGNPDQAPPVSTPSPKTSAPVPDAAAAALKQKLAAFDLAPTAKASKAVQAELDRRRKAVMAGLQADVPAMTPCDDCKLVLLDTETKCENCGAQYAVDPAPAPAAPASPAPSAQAGGAEGAIYDDEIPF